MKQKQLQWTTAHYCVPAICVCMFVHYGELWQTAPILLCHEALQAAHWFYNETYKESGGWGQRKQGCSADQTTLDWGASVDNGTKIIHFLCVII